MAQRLHLPYISFFVKYLPVFNVALKQVYLATIILEVKSKIIRLFLSPGT